MNIMPELEDIAIETEPVWLSASQVTIQYEDTQDPAVSQIDFELRRGESVLFLGPSGCGKSTLAMLLAGLIPTVVEANISGAWFRHPRLNRPGGVGYVFQDADAQFCMLTAGDEIAFGLENLTFPREEMVEKALTALRRVNLTIDTDGLQTSHAKFSGGMKQKLAMACALAMEAELLVFDEPTANLDPASTSLVFHQIAQLHLNNQTMIVIEHKFQPLLPHMDKVVLFDAEGKIHRQGPTDLVVREEWEWLQSHGVVPVWQGSPYEPKGGEFSPPTLARARVERDVHSEPAIALQEVSARYDGHPVWSDVSLFIKKGAVTAIVGPNGAGKTTLLQIMAGLQKPALGVVELLNQPITRANRKRLSSAVSYCFQNPELQFVFERVVDELANRVTEGEIPESVESLLETFGLRDVTHQSPYALSQGQKRRLSVAVMLRDPHELYFLDEPTFGQDAATQLAIMEQLERLHHDGKTIVMTTHDMDLVRRYATEVVVVAEGGVQFFGSPDDLFHRPDILKTAHLVDDMGDLSALDAFGTAPTSLAVPPYPKRSTRRPSPISCLNPAWHLVSIVVTVVFTVFVHRLSQATLVFLCPIVLMLCLGRIHPWALIRRYSAFLLFYLFYLWTYMAYSAIPPGTQHVVHILWMHADWYGFKAGLVLALRMLAAVGFGILFLSTTDLTTFASALSQSMRIPPKFSYGLMAGVHFMPLFRSEWSKLRLARRLRGREGSFWVRPALYAIPILSQAIRMSERVAIAMEARGFVGDAAATASGRTYYREVRIRGWDIAYDVVVPCIVVLLLLRVH